MKPTFVVRHISESISVLPEKVYAFAANPLNLPQWASGLSNGIEKVNGEWIAESPMGRVKVRFVDTNPFGVMDHDVTLPNGVIVTNPMRMMKNGEGSEVVFSLFKLPGVTDADYERDVELIRTDLRKLKEILENRDQK